MNNELDWKAAGSLAENWARLCYPETPEGNLARAFLAQRELLKQAHQCIADGDSGLRGEIRSVLEAQP